MDKNDRITMIDALHSVGIYKQLLDSLNDNKIQSLFSLIGWAASSSYTDDIKDEKCEHTGNKEVAEEYYGSELHQYTTYYICEDCGEEVDDEEWLLKNVEVKDM